MSRWELDAFEFSNLKNVGLCRCKKRKQEKEREDYHYSGSENEEEEAQTAGEPSSIIQAPGGDTLRRNFQQIQEGRTPAQNSEQPPPNRNQKPQQVSFFKI